MNKSRKILATLLALIISTMTITPAFAIPQLPPAIWPEPANINLNTATHSIGYKFNVTIWISTISVSYTWQARVLFNPAHLQISNVNFTRSDFNEIKSQFFVGKTVIPGAAIVDNVLGRVDTGESLLGADSRAAGADTLFWIEFTVVAAPGVGLELNSQIAVDSNAGNTFILDPDLNSIPGVTMGSTAYKYTWTAPGPARLEVTPASQSFGFPPPTLVVGTTFTSDVVITSLSAGWYLSNATTHLAYINTLLSVTSVTFDPIWGITSTAGSVPGDLYLEVKSPTSNPSGTVKIATVTFTILFQDFAPPRPFPPAPGSSDDTPLDLNTYALWSTANIPITTNTAIDGLVKIYVYQTLVPPYLSVSSATMGPGPSIGQLFNVTVSINDLSEFLNMIGVQFRLTYPATLIEPVAVYEGPFLPDYASQQPGSLGTFFVSFIEPTPPHVLVGNMILPDATGVWHDPQPKGTGVLATITFKVIYQSFGDPDMSGPLHIFEQMAIGLDNLVDQNIVDVPMLPPVDGMYTITTNLPGRNIDLFGGAVNSGYGAEKCHPFPAPYGGQGPNAPMDLVEEQSWVCLHANVTYNYWPVQHKLVGFQVNYPDGSLYANLFAFTGEFGEAVVEFRMPWPCQNPESLFGVWHVVAGVQVADVYMNDTMDYHYDYLVQIFKVTTDKYEYNHGETVEVCVTFGSHAQQEYPILLKVHIADELGVIIGHFEIATHVGGAVYCQYKMTTLCGGIWIPKYAYAGIATVHANIFDQEPIFGGAPWTPEYTPPPTIAIQPY
jgi:hypothetical protein